MTCMNVSLVFELFSLKEQNSSLRNVSRKPFFVCFVLFVFFGLFFGFFNSVVLLLFLFTLNAKPCKP